MESLLNKLTSILLMSYTISALTLDVRAGNCANGADDFSRPGSVTLKSTGDSYQATAVASAISGSDDSESDSGMRTIGFTYQSDDDECDAKYTQRKYKWGVHYALSSSVDADILEPFWTEVKAAAGVSVAKNGTSTHSVAVGCATDDGLSTSLSLGPVSLTVTLRRDNADGKNDYIFYTETDNSQGSHSPGSTITFTVGTTVFAEAQAEGGWYSSAHAVAVAYTYTVPKSEGQYTDSQCILFQYQP